MSVHNIFRDELTAVFPATNMKPELIDQGVLIEQAKWEERIDIMSSCLPAAVLNAAILTGTLEPDTAHDLHDKLLSLPDNWILTVHPDEDELISAFNNYGRDLDSKSGDIENILYQLYARAGEYKRFRLKRLEHWHLDGLTIDNEPIRVSHRLIDAVLGQTVIVSGFKKHATTIIKRDDETLEINPRNPEEPKTIESKSISPSWALRTGTGMERRTLDAIIY